MKQRSNSHEGSRFRARNLVNQLTAFSGFSSEAGSSTLNRFQWRSNPRSQLKLSPLSPLSERKIESSTSQDSQEEYVKGGDDTREHRKPCHCKLTKCLKLYCECFASGMYCNGCKCVDCHNNTENESERFEAVESILERKPNAFRPKIANFPLTTQDTVVQNKDTLLVAKHNRGCNCKKTYCVKKYCECFQANIFCSENCKCLDCKNSKVCVEKLAPSRKRKYHLSSDNCIRLANVAAFAAIRLPDYKFSSVSSNTEGQKPFGSNEKSTAIQVSTPTTSDSPPALTAGPPKFRSLLADIVRPQSIRNFCLGVVAVSDARTMRAANSVPLNKQIMKEDQGTAIWQSEEKENIPGLPGVRELVPDDHLNEKFFSGQKGLGQSPGGDALLCDENLTTLKGAVSQDTKLNHSHHTNICAKQERLVLTNFRDFLKRIIICGVMKANAMEDQGQQVCSEISKDKIEHPHLKSLAFR